LKFKNILFLPSDRGGGLGHINRCLVLAQLLQKYVCRCYFYLNHTRSFQKVNQHFPTRYIPFPKSSHQYINTILQKFKKKYAYVLFDGLEFQLLRDGIHNSKMLRSWLDIHLKYSRQDKPDLIIGDNHFLASMLGKLLQIPVIQIIRYINQPATQSVIWWKDFEGEIIPPYVTPLINKVLVNIKLPEIGDIRDLLQGDLYLIPSIPEIEPVDLNIPGTHFIGPLLWDWGVNGENLEYYVDFPQHQPLIYVTFGGGARGVSGGYLRESLAMISGDIEANFIVADPYYQEQDIQRYPPNMKFYSWVLGRKIIEQSQLVLFHGGYSTFMEVLAAGKPGLVIPFHSEQEGNGRRLKEIGCGDFILPYDEQALQTVRKKFGNKKYQYKSSEKLVIEPSHLLNVLKQLLDDREMRFSCSNMKEKLHTYQPEMILEYLRDL
jgi:UDP:flavonoid glycosyltransferase YjiC (YdhE family)